LRQVREDQLNQQGVLKVTKFKILAVAAVIASAVCFAATASLAQQPGPAQPSQGVSAQVALLDIGYVFKQNAHFQALKEGLKLEMQRADASLKAERDEIVERAKGLKEFSVGTPDYKSLEAEVAKHQAELQVKVQLTKKELMMKEAKIYHEIYNEIYQEVEAKAQTYGFVAVMQFDGERADTENPESIMREISKPMIWYNPGLDITPEVLKRLNMRSAGTANSTSRPGIPTQR
jgi:Skp family chaperone for outer membrane proteins